MSKSISAKMLCRLDIQGFESVQASVLAEAGGWLGFAFGMCSILAGIGTAMASPTVLLILVPIAFLGAVFPVHPFDLTYNFGIRHMRGAGPLPKRGAPARFACGLATPWLLATAWCFASGYSTAAYVLGTLLACTGLLVATTNICIPSMIFRAVFGPPKPRDVAQTS